MLFNVPQFIDIEDKIVGPFTAKQLGWLVAGGVTLLVLYKLLDRSAFVISAIIIAVICGGLAFYRPYNQPLANFIAASVLFVFRPKKYVWHRVTETIRKAPPRTQNTPQTDKHKQFDAKKAAEISQILDRSGR